MDCADPVAGVEAEPVDVALAGAGWPVDAGGEPGELESPALVGGVPDGGVVEGDPDDDVEGGVEPVPEAPAVLVVEVDGVAEVVPVDGVDVLPDDALVVPVDDVVPVPLVVPADGPVLVPVEVVVGCDVSVDVVVVLRGGGESAGGSTGSALQRSAITCMPGRVSVIEPSPPCCGLAPCRENGPIEAIESGAPDQWPLMVRPWTTIIATGRP